MLEASIICDRASRLPGSRIRIGRFVATMAIAVRATPSEYGVVRDDEDASTAWVSTSKPQVAVG
jgi:hypothetical protein